MMTSRSDFIDLVRVYCDGACPGKIGPAAIGVVLFDRQWNTLERESHVLGDATVNVAEYMAVITGLDLAAAHTRIDVECYTDSDVVAGQLNARYRLRDRKLRTLFQRVKDNERCFDRVTYQRVPRTDQRLATAHRLAQDALNSRPTNNTPSKADMARMER